MSGFDIESAPNPDLDAGDEGRSHWQHADHRRRGWHNLHEIARYGISLRAARVMRLEKRMDLRLAALESVRAMTSLPWFSAMVVIRGHHVLFERYAPDFGPERPHSIQSITKTTLNLIIGTLVAQGLLDLSKTTRDYLPTIGSGYADATLQSVLDMGVANDYSEDFSDPSSTYFRHEEVMGWRLPARGARQALHDFLGHISSSNVHPTGAGVDYKDANSDVLGWVAERVSGKPLRHFLADITDAAGLERALYITTDRDGTPWLAGGACLTARDLARYFSLFVRHGRAIDGREVGSTEFIGQTLRGGRPMQDSYAGIRYSNQLMVRGQTVMHSGWGGQYAIADLDSGTVGVFLSVIEDHHALTRGYIGQVIQMFDDILQIDREV